MPRWQIRLYGEATAECSNRCAMDWAWGEKLPAVKWMYMLTRLNPASATGTPSSSAENCVTISNHVTPACRALLYHCYGSFQTNILRAFPFSSMCPSCLVHPILAELAVLIKSGEVYKLQMSRYFTEVLCAASNHPTVHRSRVDPCTV
jgi:hypothetical protein